MSRRYLRLSFFIALVSLALCGSAWAQSSGSIGGTVTDTSGAVVPGAQVTVTNTATTVKTAAVSNSSGIYLANGLPVGTYKVSVQAKGFKTEAKNDVVLNVDDQLQVNVVMAVGNVNEVVNVEASQVQVELTNATQSTTINGTQIRELALVTRNYAQLVALMPGVSSASVDQLYVGTSLPSGGTATIPFAIDGTRNSMSAWLVEGADNIDRGSNQTLLNTPSIDAIAEFKVERGNFGAQLGRAGGGQIEVVLKSGASAFHGDAYEFVRNSDFLANNFYNNATSQNLQANGTSAPAPLHYNDFGWTLGGPVYVPGHYNKDKNKTFFFFSEEFRRVITYSALSAVAPTSAELTGVFPHPVCTSYTTAGVCTATGTTVPTANINPIAQEYIKDIFSKVPLPPSGTNTETNLFRNVYNFEQEVYKLDHIFSPKLTISAHFVRDQIPTQEPTGIFSLGANIPGTGGTSTNAPGHNWAVKASSAFSPTWTNEVGWSYSYGAILSTDVGLTNSQYSPDIKVTLPFPVTLALVPSIAISGGTSLGDYGPYRDFNRNNDIFDNMVKVHGTHTFRVGMVYNHYQKTENAASGNQGAFSFASAAVSPATAFEESFASFLLGNVSSFSQSSEDVTPDMRMQQFEVYAGDDWKVKSNLTINLGVRYSYFGQPVDAKNELTSFDPNLYKASAAAAMLPSGLIDLTKTTLPYLNGISINGQNSPYGSKVSTQDKTDFAPRFGFAWDPFKTGKTSVRGGYGIFYDSTLVGTFEQNIFANPPYVNAVSIPGAPFATPGGGTATISNSPKVLHATTNDFTTPYTQDWTLEVQHQFAGSMQLNVAYVGTKGTHLLGEVDLNMLPPNFAYSSGYIPQTTNFTTSTQETVLNNIRPYVGYNAITDIVPWFNSNYHSLQVYGEKKFKGDENMITFSYTWSHNLSDNNSDRSNAPENTYNFHNGEYGDATFDRRQVFNLNGIYMLPFFKTQKGFVGKTLGGWQASAIAQYYTGLPYTVSTSSSDPTALGILGSSPASGRPDQVCNPNVGGLQTRLSWFNASCFVNVPAGVRHVGDAGRSTIAGPGYEGWSLAFSKLVAFGAEGRYNFQLRGEASNAFNHTNPSTFGSLNNTSSLFNTITGYRDPRTIQIGAKFNF
jgi:hypothetical protein